MKKCVKPIQPTPTLSGKDARAIIHEALTAPTDRSVQRNEKRLADSKRVFKE